MEKDSITVGELPKHKPNISMNTINLVGNGYNALLDNASSNGIITVSTGNASGGGVDVGPKKNFAIYASHSLTHTISDVCYNQSHNKIQPYLTVNMWKIIS